MKSIPSRPSPPPSGTVILSRAGRNRRRRESSSTAPYPSCTTSDPYSWRNFFLIIPAMVWISSNRDGISASASPSNVIPSSSKVPTTGGGPASDLDFFSSKSDDDNGNATRSILTDTETLDTFNRTAEMAHSEGSPHSDDGVGNSGDDSNSNVGVVTAPEEAGEGHEGISLMTATPMGGLKSDNDDDLNEDSAASLPSPLLPMPKTEGSTTVHEEESADTDLSFNTTSTAEVEVRKQLCMDITTNETSTAEEEEVPNPLSQRIKKKIRKRRKVPLMATSSADAGEQDGRKAETEEIVTETGEVEVRKRLCMDITTEEEEVPRNDDANPLSQRMKKKIRKRRKVPFMANIPTSTADAGEQVSMKEETEEIVTETGEVDVRRQLCMDITTNETSTVEEEEKEVPINDDANSLSQRIKKKIRKRRKVPFMATSTADAGEQVGRKEETEEIVTETGEVEVRKRLCMDITTNETSTAKEEEEVPNPLSQRIKKKIRKRRKVPFMATSTADAGYQDGTKEETEEIVTETGEVEVRRQLCMDITTNETSTAKEEEVPRNGEIKKKIRKRRKLPFMANIPTSSADAGEQVSMKEETEEIVTETGEVEVRKRLCMDITTEEEEVKITRTADAGEQVSTKEETEEIVTETGEVEVRKRLCMDITTNETSTAEKEEEVPRNGEIKKKIRKRRKVPFMATSSADAGDQVGRKEETEEIVTETGEVEVRKRLCMDITTNETSTAKEEEEEKVPINYDASPLSQRIKKKIRKRQKVPLMANVPTISADAGEQVGTKEETEEIVTEAAAVSPAIITFSDNTISNTAIATDDDDDDDNNIEKHYDDDDDDVSLKDDALSSTEGKVDTELLSHCDEGDQNKDDEEKDQSLHIVEDAKLSSLPDIAIHTEGDVLDTDILIESNQTITNGNTSTVSPKPTTHKQATDGITEQTSFAKSSETLPADNKIKPTTTITRKYIKIPLPPKPKHTATVTAITWNLAEHSPTMEQSSFLKSLSKHGDDFILLGAQECENTKPRRTEGHRSRFFRRMAIHHLSKKYVPLAIHSLGGIQCMLFCSKEMVSEVDLVSVADVACGVGNVFHNKGAIGVFVRLKNPDKGGSNNAPIKLLFVTAHMAAHLKKTEARNADYWRIVSELEAQAPPRFLPPRKVTRKKREEEEEEEDGAFKIPRAVPLSSPSLSSRSDSGAGLSKLMHSDEDGPDSDCDGTHLMDSVHHVIFCGDLNYRIEMPREMACHAIQNLHQTDNLDGVSPQSTRTRFQELLSYDQLTSAISSKRAFTDFCEGQIAFLPTFKFDKGTSEYDTSVKQRVPAWTDRVLFKAKRGYGVDVLEYDSVPEANHSDHKPVFGRFCLGLLKDGHAEEDKKKKKRKK